MKSVKLHDKTFVESIPFSEIEIMVGSVAKKINADYADKNAPIFVSILNGSFMFAAELLKNIDFLCEVSFVKLASYSGINSQGEITELIGLNKDIRGRDVIVLEDIVETGNTIESIHNTLTRMKPKSIKYATLFIKPQVYTKSIPIDYYAMELKNDFIVGFGLDYNQLGRNLKDIYTIKE